MSEPSKKFKAKVYAPSLLTGTTIKVLSCIGKAKIRTWFNEDTKVEFDEAMNSEGPDILRATKGQDTAVFEIKRNLKDESEWDVILDPTKDKRPLKGYMQGDRFIIYGDQLQLQLQCFHADNKTESNDQPIYSKVAHALAEDRLRVFRDFDEFGKGLHVYFPYSQCTEFTINSDRSYIARFTVGQLRLSMQPHEYPMVVITNDTSINEERGTIRVVISNTSNEFVGEYKGSVNDVLAQIRRYLVAIPF
jgi:hypothetical protein